MCPYMAGGRSRRGSPRAGTTVYKMYFTSSILFLFTDEKTKYVLIRYIVRPQQ